MLVGTDANVEGEKTEREMKEKRKKPKEQEAKQTKCKGERLVHYNTGSGVGGVYGGQNRLAEAYCFVEI